MSALLAAIVLHIIQPPAAMPPLLRVDIVFEAPALPRHVDVAAMEEVTRIWAACGVDVRAPHPDEPGRVGAVRLAVRLADRPARPAPPEPLGSVRFIGGVPEPRVALYLDAIARFVSGASLDGHAYSEWPIVLQDATLGRALGRVLAHEIGHFLLGSRDHTAKGLMRSEQTLTDLVSLDWHRVALSAESAALLPPSADAGRKESGEYSEPSRDYVSVDARPARSARQIDEHSSTRSASEDSDDVSASRCGIVALDCHYWMRKQLHSCGPFAGADRRWVRCIGLYSDRRFRAGKSSLHA